MAGILLAGQCFAAPIPIHDLSLPLPGQMVPLSPISQPPVLKGLKVHPDNPLHFEFILQPGSSEAKSESILAKESSKLVKYFLASLTTPTRDLWVNLSPYEQDRIVPEHFGQTEMGRDLLAQDYLLKQMTASLMYPEGETGKLFWKKVYEEAAKAGLSHVPVNTFNKVWVVPGKAKIYENSTSGTCYILESSLQVMLEEDYLAFNKNVDARQKHSPSYRVLPKVAGMTNIRASQIIRSTILPVLTKEINEGQNFSHLRQVYHSLILAAWYKKKMQKGILNQMYVDQNKVRGIETPTNDINTIYERYVQAFKKGVYSLIKEEKDPVTQAVVPKKYFSGGFGLATIDEAMVTEDYLPEAMPEAVVVNVDMQAASIAGINKDTSLLNRDLIGTQVGFDGLRTMWSIRRIVEVPFAAPKGSRPRAIQFAILKEHASAVIMPLAYVLNKGKENPQPPEPGPFANSLKALMQANGISIAQMSRETQIADNVIEGYVRGAALPPVENLKGIIKSLSLTEDQEVFIREWAHESEGLDKDIHPKDMNFGQRLMYERVMRFMGRARLASYLGVHVDDIRGFETNTRAPSELIVGRLVRRFPNSNVRGWPVIGTTEFTAFKNGTKAAAQAYMPWNESESLNAYRLVKIIEWMMRQLLPSVQSQPVIGDPGIAINFYSPREVRADEKKDVQDIYDAMGLTVSFEADAETTGTLIKIAIPPLRYDHAMSTGAEGNPLDRIFGITQLPREIFKNRSIPHPETVAEHSWGTAYLVLNLAPSDMTFEDKMKAVAMALIHEMHTVITANSDSREAFKILIEGFKYTKSLSGSPYGYYLSIFDEYQRNKTRAAKLVRAAAQLDFYLQTLYYAQEYPMADFSPLIERAKQEVMQFADDGSPIRQMLQEDKYGETLRLLDLYKHFKFNNRDGDRLSAEYSLASLSWRGAVLEFLLPIKADPDKHMAELILDPSQEKIVDQKDSLPLNSSVQLDTSKINIDFIQRSHVKRYVESLAEVYEMHGPNGEGYYIKAGEANNFETLLYDEFGMKRGEEVFGQLKEAGFIDDLGFVRPEQEAAMRVWVKNKHPRLYTKIRMLMSRGLTVDTVNYERLAYAVAKALSVHVPDAVYIAGPAKLRAKTPMFYSILNNFLVLQRVEDYRSQAADAHSGLEESVAFFLLTGIFDHIPGRINSMTGPHGEFIFYDFSRHASLSKEPLVGRYFGLMPGMDVDTLINAIEAAERLDIERIAEQLDLPPDHNVVWEMKLHQKNIRNYLIKEMRAGIKELETFERGSLRAVEHARDLLSKTPEERRIMAKFMQDVLSHFEARDSAMSSPLPSLDDALNVIDQMGVEKQNIEDEVDVYRPWGGRFSDVIASSRAYLQKIRQWGKTIGVKGKVVYYPFGGMDAATAFALVEGSTDVIAFGKESFGEAQHIKSAFNEGRFNGVLDNNYIKGKVLEKMPGTGAAALAAIILRLKGKLFNVTYLDVDQNGTIVPRATYDPSRTQHAVITFDVWNADLRRHQEKRFWYFQNAIGPDSNSHAFKRLVQTLPFDVMLIKGAYDILGPNKINPEINSTYVRQITTQPAWVRNAYVITDERLDKGVSYDIWRKDRPPLELDLGKDEFGYGHTIYHGQGNALKIESDAAKPIIRLMPQVFPGISNDDAADVLDVMLESLNRPTDGRAYQPYEDIVYHDASRAEILNTQIREGIIPIWFWRHGPRYPHLPIFDKTNLIPLRIIEAMVNDITLSERTLPLGQRQVRVRPVIQREQGPVAMGWADNVFIQSIALMHYQGYDSDHVERIKSMMRVWIQEKTKALHGGDAAQVSHVDDKRDPVSSQVEGIFGRLIANQQGNGLSRVVKGITISNQSLWAERVFDIRGTIQTVYGDMPFRIRVDRERSIITQLTIEDLPGNKDFRRQYGVHVVVALIFTAMDFLYPTGEWPEQMRVQFMPNRRSNSVSREIFFKGIAQQLIRDGVPIEKAYSRARMNGTTDSIVLKPHWFDKEKMLRVLNSDPKGVADGAMTGDSLGGIDLTSTAQDTEISLNEGREMEFLLDPARIEELKQAPGLTPVIVNIRHLADVRAFLQ